MLHSTPGTVGTTLADETTVVVQSEMGRTPQLNATNGKDHWPYTSLMMLGPGLTTDRVVGAFNDGYVGELVDLGSAEVTASGRTLSVEAIGAALLVVGIDPAEHIAGADPLLGFWHEVRRPWRRLAHGMRGAQARQRQRRGHGRVRRHYHHRNHERRRLRRAGRPILRRCARRHLGQLGAGLSRCKLPVVSPHHVRQPQRRARRRVL